MFKEFVKNLIITVVFLMGSLLILLAFVGLMILCTAIHPFLGIVAGIIMLSVLVAVAATWLDTL